MECLKEVFSRIQPLHRGKDARVSQEKRRAAEEYVKQGDLEKSLALASQAVLRSPMTGNPQKESYSENDGEDINIKINRTPDCQYSEK